MMTFAPGIITALVVLIALLPALLIALLLDLVTVWRLVGRPAQRWHAVPLHQRNRTRATAGAFVLALCAVIAANGFPVVGWQVTCTIAAFGLLYFCVGIHGSQGARFDVMSVFWWAVLALGCGALLAIKGFPL
jgi:hypothetical protein